jgi:hypothetical protein
LTAVASGMGIVSGYAVADYLVHQARSVRQAIAFPNPVVAESLLDRLINTSHQVFMNGPSYRPNKRPQGAARPPQQDTE